MDISELKLNKSIIEKEIKDLCVNFQQKTGVEITNIDIESMSITSIGELAEVKITNIKIGVKF